MKDILDYPEVTTPAADDYILVDSATNGTKKILVSDLVGGGSNEQADN